MIWLKGRFSIPDLIEYTEYENRECMLMTELKGKHIDTFIDEHDYEKIEYFILLDEMF